VRGRTHGGWGCTFLRPSGRSLLCALLAIGCLLATPASGLADTAPIPQGAPVPGTDPGHQTPLELLASRIASHIAGRAVTVSCEGDAAWAARVGGDPSAESGFVATTWLSNGQLLSLSSTAELASSICLPLQQFAQATVKPTKCLVKNVGLLAGRRATARKPRPKPPSPVPCYVGGGKMAIYEPPSFWAAYSADAIAILTLAHESIHLSGVVGGQTASGLALGDQQAEAKADCFGMQWMPYVAEQLGDTPDDAQAIARFFWDTIYPLDQVGHADYWSPDCRPGGALDERPSGTTAWP
jgi:hypothetical protein